MYVCVSICDGSYVSTYLYLVFDKLTGDQHVLQKLLYLSANILILGLAMWKLRNMGLLPTAQSDWVEFIEAREVSLLM